MSYPWKSASHLQVWQLSFPVYIGVGASGAILAWQAVDIILDLTVGSINISQFTAGHATVLML